MGPVRHPPPFLRLSFTTADRSGIFEYLFDFSCRGKNFTRKAFYNLINVTVQVLVCTLANTVRPAAAAAASEAGRETGRRAIASASERPRPVYLSQLSFAPGSKTPLRRSHSASSGANAGERRTSSRLPGERAVRQQAQPRDLMQQARWELSALRQRRDESSHAVMLPAA